MKINYRDLGLKVGLEIHIQLDTGRKLFCHCPPIIKNEPPDFRIVRRLRPTLSELGQVDPAAMWEFRKHRTYIYEGYHDCTCLVEIDEEPPHEPDPRSIEVALMISKKFNAKIFDELYVMRKIVVDGSNVSGFQRTMLVAHDGVVRFFQYKVPIWTVALEEDAARKIEEKEDYVVYRLDRLGIPLIEIVTGPLEYGPNQVMEIAYYIGHTVKLTGMAKRGIGTVRQDINISISRGAKTEIKGIPELSLIPKVIEYEVKRQLNLLKICEELNNRGVKENDLIPDYHDVTDVFQNTKSGIVKNILKSGGKIIAIKTPKFEGLLGYEVQPGRRFGTEIADYVRAWTSLKGILHSDELPGYGITSDEVSKVKSKLNVNSFILLAGIDEEELKEAVKVITERLRQAIKGVPEETRAVNPDGTTKFMRPRPGAARMYPETDLRPIRITFELVQEIEKKLPPSIEELVSKYVSYGISKELAEQIIRAHNLELIDRLIESFKDKVSPTIIASTMISTLKSIQREGYNTDVLEEKHFIEIFNMLSEGEITKEAIPEILKKLCQETKKNVKDIVKELNLEKVSYDEVKRIVAEIIQEVGIKEKRRIIGLVMKRYRGKVAVEDIEKALHELER